MSEAPILPNGRGLLGKLNGKSVPVTVLVLFVVAVIEVVRLVTPATPTTVDVDLSPIVNELAEFRRSQDAYSAAQLEILRATKLVGEDTRDALRLAMRRQVDYTEMTERIEKALAAHRRETAGRGQ